MRFDVSDPSIPGNEVSTVEPPPTHVKEVYIPCNLCEGVESSVLSNHPELMWKTSTHLASSVKMWFEKVRGGSRRLNHPERVHEHPAHLVSPVKM